MLLVVTPSGFSGELATGDAIDTGDVLITAAGTRALIALNGGGTLTMTANSRAVITEPVEAADGSSRIVILSGAFVLDAPATAAGDAPVHVESAAAGMMVEGATIALSYELATGLRAALMGVTAGGDGAVNVVNEGGRYGLDPGNPAVVVAHWSDPPAPLSVAEADGLPAWLPAMTPAASAIGDGADAAANAFADADADADADTDAGAGTGAGAPPPDDLPLFQFALASDAPDQAPEAGADVAAGIDEAPVFSTGAGLPDAGDVSFIAAPASARGLGDHPVAGLAAPGPVFAGLPAPSLTAAAAATSARALPPSAPDHGLDALLGLQPPPVVEQPTLPRPPGPPHLTGWEPTARVWEYEGFAFASGGDRVGPWRPDQPLELVRPVEGASMALLEPNGAWATDLEGFLGLPNYELRALVDGVRAHDGSALRTSMVLQAGQTLVFDTRFDAYDSLPRNDFAAFTIAKGDEGEAFLISDIEATGSFGATPWQSLEYTAGTAGRYTIGFVVINDLTPMAPSRLYVDNLRGHLDTDGLVSIGGEDDAFGGRFTLYQPEAPAPEPDPVGGTLITSFEARLGWDESIGRIEQMQQFIEPDGSREVYSATDGDAMAVLHAVGANRAAIERFLGLQPAPGEPTALPFDTDGSAPAFGSATRLTVAVAAGDQLSFDWLFDAGDTLPDNDYAVFTVADADTSAVFKLADVRAVGDEGASGWRTSVYTAAEDAELTVGFGVVNDRAAGYYNDTENSRLLIDNVRLNRDLTDGYQTVDLPDPGTLATLPVG